MKAEKGFIVYPTYIHKEDKTFVLLYGRLANGESFVSVSEMQPYFYIREKDQKKIKKYLGKFSVEKTKFSNFSGESVVKISHATNTELNKLHKHIYKTVDTYEADIKPHMRFLMDHNILGNLSIEGDYTSSERIDRIYQDPTIKPLDRTHIPKLKIASIDIESDKTGGELYCIGIVSDNYKKNFFVGSQKLKDTVSCKTEAECLEKFKSALLGLDPDIITGWNMIDFDLSLLRAMFAKHNIPFDLGRDNSPTKLRIESGFFRSSKADMSGRQVLDGLNLIRDPIIRDSPLVRDTKFESFTLEGASQALLKTGKLLKGSNRHLQIDELYLSKKLADNQKLVNYNLLDCDLVYQILKKSKTIELAIERSQLTGLPLDRISGSIAAFDSLYIRNAHKKGIVSPSNRFGLKEERITGGYVQSSKPGIYHNVLILDFKSLYPSIIKTFNIDPASFLESAKSKDKVITSPNKAHFKNTDGILPIIISELHTARESAKKRSDLLASHAIKITMNSFFGVLASPSCRYFNLDMANAITHFAQYIIKLTVKEIEKLGYKVIYGDTDSVFVDTNLGKAKANALGLELQKKINTFFDKHVKSKYDRKSFLELEFEKQYLSMVLPAVRGSTEGAKKRYAGLLEKNGKEELEITGLEAIRGDWTEAAQEFQTKLLMRVFKKQPIKPFIKSYIKKIMNKELDSKLVYRKSLRKPLEEYVKTTPPHVKAARKLKKLESKTVEYYITTDGPEPLQNLNHKLDYEHYIKKQIEPIANQILQLLGEEFSDVLQGSKQKTLF